MGYFNHTFRDGKWDHFMDQTHLGYTTWQDPPQNSLRAITLSTVDVAEAASMGVAIEGTDSSWPGHTEQNAVLPGFDVYNQQRHYIDVYNRGKDPFKFTVRAEKKWITVSSTHGEVTDQIRIWVGVDWTRAPKDSAHGTVEITGTNATVSVGVDAFNPVEPGRSNVHGFVEGEGYISMEAEHFSNNRPAGNHKWTRIEDYGHTLSAMRSTAPVDAPSATPGKDSPCLEYQMYLFSTGKIEVEGIFGATLNFVPGRGVRYAVSFDDETPQIVTLVPESYNVQNGNWDWAKSVENNARYSHTTHTIATPGYHLLKVWMVDPGVVLEKIVVDAGGAKPSYLGPPESFRGALRAMEGK
jgi:hypothetical protein